MFSLPMKHAFLTGLLCLLALGMRPAPALIYQVDLKEEVNSVSWLQIKKGFAAAAQDSAATILIHMNTYGGEVLYADSIRTLILNTQRPVCVFIDPNAASAGALISIACDKIFMRPGATIGASTVVNQTGAAAPDKYQSYMRGMMRATAEAKGRDPRIAEAMVDPDVAVAGVVDTGKVLTLTAEEALQLSYCDAIIESIPEIVSQQLGYEQYELKHYTFSRRDRMKGHLMGSAFRAILIMIIIAGIWFELQSPGIGFPTLAAVVAAVLYFAPLYFDGLADYWEIILFFAGVVCLLLEIFVIPGFGVAGILGIVAMITGLSFALIDNRLLPSGEFPYLELGEALLLVIFSVAVAVVLCLWLSSRVGKGQGLFRRLALETSQDRKEGFVAVPADELASMTGKTGVAATVLRPGGKVRIEGQVYDAVAEFGYIESEQAVRVTRSEAGQLYVRAI